MRRLETTSLPIPHPCHLSRHLARHEHVDELHTEPARRDARDRPNVACARRRQVKPRAFGRPVVPTSPQPPPGAAIAAHAFVTSSAHAMSTQLWRTTTSHRAGRGAEPCGVARQNTEDRRKGRARCGCKEAMLKSCRRGAHHSGFCCNSPARPQRQWVLITASAANQPRGGNKKAKKLQFLHTAPLSTVRIIRGQ